MFNKLLTSSLSYIKCRGVKTLNMDMDTIGDDLTYPPRNPLNKMINYFKTINLSIHEFESFQLHTLALIQFPTNGILVPAIAYSCIDTPAFGYTCYCIDPIPNKWYTCTCHCITLIHLGHTNSLLVPYWSLMHLVTWTGQCSHSHWKIFLQLFGTG